MNGKKPNPHPSIFKPFQKRFFSRSFRFCRNSRYEKWVSSIKTTQMLAWRRPLPFGSRNSWRTSTQKHPLKKMERQGIKWQKRLLFIKTCQVTMINGGLSLVMVSKFGSVTKFTGERCCRLWAELGRAAAPAGGCLSVVPLTHSLPFPC